MRFRKGSKVEVLRKAEVPSGSWWCAEIISGNGHNYNVRYQQSPDMTTVERVPRKVIRPLPPLGDAENWVPGDIVEVFHNYSWKIAEVSEVMDRNYFLVRLLGSSLEFCVHKLDLRIRQSWQNNEWIVIAKVARNCGDTKLSKSPTAIYDQISNCQVLHRGADLNDHDGDDQLLAQKRTCFQEALHKDFPRRSGKRGLQICLSAGETTGGPGRKVRVIEKVSRLSPLTPLHRPRPLDKVDAVASPRIVLGEKYMHASFNNNTHGFPEMGVEESRNHIAEVGCFFQKRIEPDRGTENRECSVASCSSNTLDTYNIPFQYREGPSQDNYLDDAESSNGDGGEYSGEISSQTNEEMEAKFRRLDLHAYRSTMEALYASGPLTWEQEEMMTNLRISLNISNDEHLLQLKHLVSAGS